MPVKSKDITKEMENLALKHNKVKRQSSNSSSSGKSSCQGLKRDKHDFHLNQAVSEMPIISSQSNGKTSPASYDSGMPSSQSCHYRESEEGYVILPSAHSNNHRQHNQLSQTTSADQAEDLLPVGNDPTGRIQEFLKNSTANQRKFSLTSGGNSSHKPRQRRHSGRDGSQYYSFSHDPTHIESFSQNPNNFNGPISHGDKHRNERKNDKKSRTGVSLGVCKNGGGGKFTWGRPGIEYTSSCPSGAKDVRDPNYDDFEEDENTIFDVRSDESLAPVTDEEIQRVLFEPFREYLANSDDSELALLLEQLDVSCASASRVYFHLLLWSLESSKKLRGHVWVLVKKLLFFNNGDSYFSDEKSINKCLEDFFDARVELIIDNPDYDEFIQKMLACLIFERGNCEKEGAMDLFLAKEMKLRAKTFSKVVAVSYSIVSRIKSSTAIMSEIWVTDGYLTPEQLSFELSKIVDDWKYDGFSSRSLAQDLRSGVNAPHYYHELVYLLLIKSLNIGTLESLKAVVETLKYLLTREIVESTQVKTGFLRIFNDFDELKIDIPKCTVLISKIVNMAANESVITDEVRVKMPRMKGDRRRALSEMV